MLLLALLDEHSSPKTVYSQNSIDDIIRDEEESNKRGGGNEQSKQTEGDNKMCRDIHWELV